MYEKLIQKLINRKVGDIGGTLTPTGGTTYCTIVAGSFPKTYDGYSATYCCFKTNMSCLSEWYWDTPVDVTKFNILSLFYGVDSYIAGMWGRVSGSWVQLWSGTWHPTHGYWDSVVANCNNCTGIRISQLHDIQPSNPCILEVSIDYEEAPPPPPPPEETLTEAVTCKWVTGFQNHGAEITQFDIDETVYAYAEIALHGNDAYGKVMKHEWWYKKVGESDFTKKWEWESACSSHYTNNWSTWTWWAIGLSYGAGTGYIKIFYDGVYMGKTNNYTIIDYPEGKSTITGITKPNTFTPNVSFDIDTTIRNDGGDDYLFGKLVNTDTGDTLDEYTTLNKICAGRSWVYDVPLTLVQNTDFHGRVDAGHVE